MREDLLFANGCPNEDRSGTAVYVDGGDAGPSIVTADHVTIVGHACPRPPRRGGDPARSRLDDRDLGVDPVGQRHRRGRRRRRGVVDRRLDHQRRRRSPVHRPGGRRLLAPARQPRRRPGRIPLTGRSCASSTPAYWTASEYGGPAHGATGSQMRRSSPPISGTRTARSGARVPMARPGGSQTVDRGLCGAELLSHGAVVVGAEPDRWPSRVVDDDRVPAAAFTGRRRLPRAGRADAPLPVGGRAGAQLVSPDRIGAPRPRPLV